MPAYEAFALFYREYRKLTEAQRAAFKAAAKVFRVDLAKGEGFSPGLRVKKVVGHEGVWELTWAPNGRATFSYGDVIRDGHHHVVWRRTGGHEIFTRP